MHHRVDPELAGRLEHAEAVGAEVRAPHAGQRETGGREQGVRDHDRLHHAGARLLGRPAAIASPNDVPAGPNHAARSSGRRSGRARGSSLQPGRGVRQARPSKSVSTRPRSLPGEGVQTRSTTVLDRARLSMSPSRELAEKPAWATGNDGFRSVAAASSTWG